MGISDKIVTSGSDLFHDAVFTNGCFDLLHFGHVKLLEKCKCYGDWLIVAVNSDTSVKRLKGDSRPIVPQEQRAFMLAALQFVDQVLIFDEDTPEEICRVCKPKVVIKGGDWSGKKIAGAEFAKQGAVCIPLEYDISTTKIVTEIQNQKRQLFLVGGTLVIAISAIQAEAIAGKDGAKLVEDNEPVSLLRPTTESFKFDTRTAKEWAEQEQIGIIGECNEGD